MSTDEPREIVIIRRRRDEGHEEAHGGVWKVAFADFMTAMMAFFLVLWIVNSTSKETRASVARYFNPVRLSDTTPARKGLQEPREEDFDAAGKAVTDADKKPAGKEAQAPEPAAAPVPAGVQAGADRSAAATEALRAGQAIVERFEDPFEPVAPSREAPAVPQAASPGIAEPAAKPAQPMGQSAESIALDRALQAIVKAAGAHRAPMVDVRETSEGLLISLTDRADFGMFAVGSTEPNAALVRLMTDLGGVLKPMGSAIVVRGFTDARRYRKAGNDNWRLSTGRAQSACDLLLRGGVDERRIMRIEGHADRNLRNPGDPEAAENRRVEILLRKDGA